MLFVTIAHAVDLRQVVGLKDRPWREITVLMIDQAKACRCDKHAAGARRQGFKVFQLKGTLQYLANLRFTQEQGKEECAKEQARATLNGFNVKGASAKRAQRSRATGTNGHRF